MPRTLLNTKPLVFTVNFYLCKGNIWLNCDFNFKFATSYWLTLQLTLYLYSAVNVFKNNKNTIQTNDCTMFQMTVRCLLTNCAFDIDVEFGAFLSDLVCISAISSSLAIPLCGRPCFKVISSLIVLTRGRSPKITWDSWNCMPYNGSISYTRK